MKIKREVKIGLFALAMLACLYMGVNYLKGKQVFSGDRIYHALFDDTQGLQTSAPVLLRGVKIGTVTDISIDGEHSDKVVVTVAVKKDMSIPVDSRLKLFSSGIMGDRAIELVRGRSESRFEQGAVIPSETDGGLLQSASLGIDDLVGEIKTMVNSLEATSVTLNTILSENADNFGGVVQGLESTLAQFSDGRVSEMLADVGGFTSMLRDNSARFESVMSNLEIVTAQLAQSDLHAMLDTLGMGVTHLNSVLAAISRGEGTVGRLATDPALYDSLAGAVSNLDALLTDLRANPKRYVHFSLFGRGRDKNNK